MPQINRNIKPSESGPIKFNLPDINKFKLKNGLKIHFVKNETLPFLYSTLVIDSGSKCDPAGKKGLAYLYSLMADEGAGKFDALQLSDQFDIIGAHFSISCNQDSIYFSLQVLKDDFERGLELLENILTQPHLKEEDFNREKRKVKTRLLQNKDEADEIANEVFEYKLLGPQNPYAFPTIGYDSDINSISVEDVKKFKTENICPAKSFMVIVGDFEPTKLEMKLNNVFSDWNDDSSAKPPNVFKSTVNPGIYLVDKMDSVQSEIRTGLISANRNEYDYFARSILNMILGGQFSSRINLNLRENKGYTYGVFSRFIFFKDSAYFYVSTSVGIENSAASVSEIYSEIKKIRNGVSKEELEFAKSSLIRKFPSNFESYRQIASNIVGQVIHALPTDYFNLYINEINKVTPERVAKAAEDNLNDELLTTIIVGDRNKLIEQIQKTFHSNIIELDNNGKEISKF
jgi:zinc protease